MRQSRTLNNLARAGQWARNQGSINYAHWLRPRAIEAREQLEEHLAKLIHEDYEMVSTFEIRLPNGLILGVEGNPNRKWREPPESEAHMMAKLREAILTTDWAAVVALYGRPPARVNQEPILELGKPHVDKPKAAPKPPAQAAAPSPGFQGPLLIGTATPGSKTAAA